MASFWDFFFFVTCNLFVCFGGFLWVFFFFLVGEVVCFVLLAFSINITVGFKLDNS